MSEALCERHAMLVCEDCAYERGRADERASVVAWLKSIIAADPRGLSSAWADGIVLSLNRGDHLRGPAT